VCCCCIESPHRSRPVSSEPRAYQQRARVGLPPHKRAVEFGGVFAVALRQNIGSESLAHVPAENAALAEAGEGVGIQHLGPFVRVVSRAVTHWAAEQMS